MALLQLIIWLIALSILPAALAGPAAAQACTKQDIANLIDSTAERLRQLNAAHQPELKAKLRQLGDRLGWSEEEREAKAAEFLDDDETRALDEQAGKLLVELDVIGDEAEIDPSTCRSRLEKLKKISAQLLEITTAKAAHASARIDAELNALGPLGRSAQQPGGKAGARTATRTEPSPKSQPPMSDAPALSPPETREARPTPPTVSGWDTDTVRHATPGEADRAPAPEVLADLSPDLRQSEELEFSVEEIRAAGRGFFGSLSAGLASVIEYAFQTYGRPNGYILGSEGGAALLAGLRYGDGRLVTKFAGEQKVYWQGPSVGYDVGLAGSRVMFLVYNLERPEDLFARFMGVDGSAYVVGGVGVTLLKKGRIVLAPIRTGLGVRVGANVGYLKFTPERSLNPF